MLDLVITASRSRFWLPRTLQLHAVTYVYQEQRSAWVGSACGNIPCTFAAQPAVFRASCQMLNDSFGVCSHLLRETNDAVLKRVWAGDHTPVAALCPAGTGCILLLGPLA